MARLNFMRTADDFMEYRAVTWQMEIGEGQPPIINADTKFPCLGLSIPVRYAFNPEALGMITLVCSKNEAKRIVYPETNRNRSRANGGFIIIEGDDLKDAMEVYITRSLERLKRSGDSIDSSHPIQRRMLDRVVSDFDGAKGLALVLTRTYINLDRFRLVDFYTVDETDARKLVYWNRKPIVKLKHIPHKRETGFEKFVRGMNV